MDKTTSTQTSAQQLIQLLFALEEDVLSQIETASEDGELLRITYLGKDSEFGKIASEMRTLQTEEKKQVGVVLNQVKKTLDEAIGKKSATKHNASDEWIDVTAPGNLPPQGSLHIVTGAIEEITTIFNTLSFTRVRHPEIDWDYYAFEALNMPKNHPARDEWETFFIQYPGKPKEDSKYQKIVLTPHTSNGQIREMEKKLLPIRMINIAKCYRRQIDASHNVMFHQFEGLYIDTHVSIGHLKGVLDYFAMNFFGKERKTRIRPHHFQFTEPSFEVDISCGICNGRGCKLCKEGWLELGGAGMVHPNVLKAGGVDPTLYNGFAFGWGVERSLMMKSDTHIDDIRLLNSNDIRFLKQF